MEIKTGIWEDIAKLRKVVELLAWVSFALEVYIVFGAWEYKMWFLVGLVSLLMLIDIIIIWSKAKYDNKKWKEANEKWKQEYNQNKAEQKE